MSTNRPPKTPLPPRTTAPKAPKPAAQQPAEAQAERTYRTPPVRRSSADRDKAANMAAQGHATRDISRAIGVTVETVREWRRKYNWPNPNDLPAKQQTVLNSGQHLPSDASDPRTSAILIQHRAQADTMRRQLDNILALPDLGAGPKGSISQAAERVSAALVRLHTLDRQAHGMGTGDQASVNVAVIVVPQRACSSADWSKDVRAAVDVDVDVTQRLNDVRRRGRELSKAAGGGQLVGTRDLLALPPSTDPAADKPIDPATAGPDRDPFHRGADQEGD